MCARHTEHNTLFSDPHATSASFVSLSSSLPPTCRLSSARSASWNLVWSPLQLQILQPWDSGQSSVMSSGFVGNTWRGKYYRIFGYADGLPKMSKPNFLSTKLNLKKSVSDSTTHEHVKMAHVDLRRTLSTAVQALKCPSSWTRFLSST